MRYGRESPSFQILNPGFEQWFHPDCDAVVGYVERGGWLVCGGGPVGPEWVLREIAADFEAFAARSGRKVCYVCAEEPLRARLEATGGYSSISMGAQPVWNPREWAATAGAGAALRKQLRRAERKRVQLDWMDAAKAAAHPGLRRTLREWLQGRRLPPMRFLVEPEILASATEDRWILRARHEGETVAFLVATPVPRRNGYFVEQLARSRRAPNGTSELLIDAAMRRFASAGCEHATLGLVALRRGTIGQNPLWLRILMNLARTHANRFYNFRGLERFRAKLHPAAWEPVYAIANERRFPARALYAVGGAFAGISPLAAIGIALINGARQELGYTKN